MIGVVVPIVSVSGLPSPSMSMVADTTVSGSLSGSLSMPFAVMTLVTSSVSSAVVSVSSTATGASLTGVIVKVHW